MKRIEIDEISESNFLGISAEGLVSGASVGSGIPVTGEYQSKGDSPHFDGSDLSASDNLHGDRLQSLYMHGHAPHHQW